MNRASRDADGKACTLGHPSSASGVRVYVR